MTEMQLLDVGACTWPSAIWDTGQLTETLIVVTGAAGRGDVAPTGEFPKAEVTPTGKFPTELTTGAGEIGGTIAVLGLPAGGGAAGVGTKVIVLGTLVMIPGF